MEDFEVKLSNNVEENTFMMGMEKKFINVYMKEMNTKYEEMKV